MKKIRKPKTGKKKPTSPHEIYLLLQKAAQLHQGGDLKQATELFKKILRADPKHADAINFLGIIASQEGDYKQAKQYFRRAIKILPNVPLFHKNLGNVLKNQENYEDAISSYQIVLKYSSSPKAVREAHTNIGKVLSKMDRHEEAIASFQKALDLNPDSAEIHIKLGLENRDLGRFAEAIDHYQKALEINPDSVETLHDLASCKKYTREDEEEIRRVKMLAEQPELTEEQKAIACFTLGKIYNDLKEYDKAFEHFRAGNALRHKLHPFDAATFKEQVARTIKTFTADFFAKRKNFGSLSKVPIFIVGMPRSGTTLVEQIIASHSRIKGAGELRYIGKIAQSLSGKDKNKGYPDNVINLKERAVLKLAGEYEASIKRFKEKDTSHVTDKMPANFLHLGLIALLFPEARIVHCRRNPMDTCLSNYFQSFTNGNEQSYDLESIADFYRQYDRLMAHWRKILPLPLYEVVYEELTEEPEQITRELIDFVGLEWEENCLSFHRSNRPVKTASVWQARQPIYKDSRERWRRYENFLGPLIKRLGEKETPSGKR